MHRWINAFGGRMKFSEKKIEAIRESGMLKARQRKLSDDKLHDVFTNNAPSVEDYTAEQSKGASPVHIRGVPGAYFVDAMAFDDDLSLGRRASSRSKL
jgi:hypothetical protein